MAKVQEKVEQHREKYAQIENAIIKLEIIKDGL